MGLAGAALVSASIMLGVVLSSVAESPYKCEYAAAPTLANKRSSGGSRATLSAGVGAALGVGLVLGLAVWWRPWLTPNQQPPDRNSRHDVAARTQRLVACNGQFSGEREAEAQHQEGTTSFFSVTHASCLVLGAVVLAAGPNVAYVFAVLSDLPHEAKLASEVGITLVKTAVSTMITPSVARRAALLLVPNVALPFARFRLRVALGTTLSALSTIVAPVAIVLVTDERCLYHAWHPPNEVTTDVTVEFCGLSAASVTGGSQCITFSRDLIQSTYTPEFEYDGSRCVSAVIGVYAPVFVGSVLLTAVLPAALELLVVPTLAPWCHRKSASSPMARRCLAVLRDLTLNVLPVLAEAKARAEMAGPSTETTSGATDPLTFPPLPPINVDTLAQRVVERGLVQLVGTLLIALTFGLAAPVVGGACAVAVLVQLVHHLGMRHRGPSDLPRRSGAGFGGVLLCASHLRRRGRGDRAAHLGLLCGGLFGPTSHWKRSGVGWFGKRRFVALCHALASGAG